MTVEGLIRELEQILSDICFSGIKNAPPIFIEKLKAQGRKLGEIGLAHGEEELNRFCSALRAYQLGETEGEEAAFKLCAMAFYCENVLGNLSGVRES